jgi:hypothetical protein
VADPGTALLTPLVVFQCYFVLTRYHRFPRARAAATLRDLLAFKGLSVPEKAAVHSRLTTLCERGGDLEDAYPPAVCDARHLTGVHTFDSDRSGLGVDLLSVA